MNTCDSKMLSKTINSRRKLVEPPCVLWIFTPCSSHVFQVVFAVFALCFVLPICQKDVNAEIFTIGYLTNINTTGVSILGRQGMVISGALSYAVEVVNKNKNLPDGHQLNYSLTDVHGELLTGTKSIIEYWNEGVVAIFGPESSCRVEATVAASLNLPLFSYSCPDYPEPGSSLPEFKTFAQMNPPQTMIVKSVISLLRYYQWMNFSLFYEKKHEYQTVAVKIEKDATQQNFTILNVEIFNPYFETCEKNKDCENQFVKIVNKTYTTTRVFVFLGRISELIRFLMVLKAKELLHSGEYIVIYIDLESYSEGYTYKYIFRWGDDTLVQELQDAVRSLLVVTSTPPKGDGYHQFIETVRKHNEMLLKNNASFFDEILKKDIKPHISIYASYLYDSVMVYTKAFAEVLRKNEYARNGSQIIDYIKRIKSYESIAGTTMHINEDGVMEGNYTVLARLPIPENFSLPYNVPRLEYLMLPVGTFQYQEGNAEPILHLEKAIDWVAGGPPHDSPPCGFDGSLCRKEENKGREIAAGILALWLILGSFITTIIYGRWKYEKEIAGLLWKIDLREIQRSGHKGLIMFPSKLSLMSQASFESKIVDQIFTETAMFKGNIVALKKICLNRGAVDIPRETKKEMRLMRDIHHDNINQFIGSCLEDNTIYIVTEYCSKGSLQDILENDEIKLDNLFIASLVFDLIKGMIFLHESDLKVHGNLKSSNCVVTSRWVLQVTDYGLHDLRAEAISDHGDMSDHEYYRNLLWRAPELLRDPSAFSRGTQKGDIYAFGIILHEIIARQGPFGYTKFNPQEIIERVKQCPCDVAEPFRPDIANLDCQDYVLQAMRDAWQERADQRPDFRHFRERLQKMRQGMKSNIMDNMMAIMEKYANNLEELVDEKTLQVVEEKKKTEALLHRMLPQSVAAQLMRGEPVIPESFDAVTIYFSDIVGFTEMSATSTPMEVVMFLNDLYTVFDAIISHYDVYKVETIGDAYMVVSGLPIRNGDKHASEIASMSLELLDSIKSFRIRHKPNQTLKLRIGIHTGPVVAGVVGLTMPRYCLFGDTVNTASRMESNGEALKIHISPECKDYLERLGGYIMEERGLVKMKGKGEIRTYWLQGNSSGPYQRQDPTKDLVPPPPLFTVRDSSDLKRRSPKLIPAEFSRRGSLAPRRNSSFAHSVEDAVISGPGMPAFLRVSQDSPRNTKRFNSQNAPRDSRTTKVNVVDPKDADSVSGSFVEVHGTSRAPVESAVLSPSHPVAIHNRSDGATESDTAPSSGYNSRLESAASTDCDACHMGNGHGCRCQLNNDSSRNGLIGIDETLRPLLSSRENRSDTSSYGNERKHSRTSLLKLPSKRWRSCDEITLPKGSRSSLKGFFAGLLGNRILEGEMNKGSNSSVGVCRSIRENEKDESLV